MRGAQDGVHQQGSSRERAFGSASVITTLRPLFLFPGQGDNFEILDIVDSKGSLAVKFHPQITFKIAFHIFQEKNIKLEKSEIPQEFLDSLKNK